jgi:hypothetical protein
VPYRDRFVREVWDGKLSYVIQVSNEGMLIRKFVNSRFAEVAIDTTSLPWVLEVSVGEHLELRLCVDDENFKVEIGTVQKMTGVEDVEKFIDELENYLVDKIKRGFEAFRSLTKSNRSKSK